MDFKEIAAVSGKPGLFRILKPTRNGVVLESLDDKKDKLVISSNTRVSILKDISMYTLTADGNKPLIEIMQKIKELFANALPVSPKSDDKDLRSFFEQVVPDFDKERVYTSDIKKLVNWYGIISVVCPEVLDAKAEETTTEEGAEKTDKKVAKIDKPGADTKVKKAVAKTAAPKAQVTGAEKKVTRAKKG